jgi:hypothetical protein
MLAFLNGAVTTPAAGSDKDIDYTPDLTAEAYWDSHHICLVRVTGTWNDAAGKEWIAYRVLRQFSTDPVEQTRSLLLAHLWFGPAEAGQPRIESNTLLVVYYAKVSPSPTVVAEVRGDPRPSPLVRRLERISDLRAQKGGFEALTEAVFDPDQVIALYCLKRLLSSQTFPPPAGYVARLLTQRENPARDSQVRLLTSDLVNKLEAKPAASEDDYLWLRAAVEQSKAEDWTQLRPFLNRLLDFASKRTETVAFLCGLATDAKRAEATRIAAYSTFDDSRLFHFTQPDAESERIFNACIEMLKDRQPVMRRAGAALLYNISVRINPELSRNYIGRARTAIAEAISVEADEGTSSQMKTYLGLLSKRA